MQIQEEKAGLAARKHADLVQNAPPTPPMQIQEEKAGLAAKLEGLRAMVAQLEDFDPEWESRERGECEALSREITALTAQKEALELSAAAVRGKRDGMLAGIEGLKQARGA